MKKFKLDDEARRKLALAQGGLNSAVVLMDGTLAFCILFFTREVPYLRLHEGKTRYHLLYIDSFLFGGLLDHNLNISQQIL